MSEPKQQPKVLLHKPKKSQRSPPGVSQSTKPAAASFSKPAGDSAGGARSVSTAPGTSPPTGPKQPLWYRFRTALTTLLVVNAVLIGYTLFRTSSKPSEISEEVESVKEVAPEKEKDEDKPKEAEKEKESVDTKSVLPEPSEVTQAVISQAIISQEVNKPKLSSEDQQEVFKWMLAEKRKIKPASKAEKAQIDAEKAVLKEYLRRKIVLNV